MRNRIVVTGLIMLLALPCAARAAQWYDGQWEIVTSCEKSTDSPAERVEGVSITQHGQITDHGNQVDVTVTDYDGGNAMTYVYFRTQKACLAAAAKDKRDLEEQERQKKKQLDPYR